MRELATSSGSYFLNGVPVGKKSFMIESDFKPLLPSLAIYNVWLAFSFFWRITLRIKREAQTT
ncbi:hypothetical protein KQH34_01825 [Erwinia amylovora]|uniref:Uncharacterized protein n=3 Tax=Erwinia amylovora TaxID=552 RepID=A0A831EQL5_ERWAM|nr:hypothetical protein AD997_08185 [Erwinia amylovora]EKV54329.1 hypothetical protein EaACW_1631 [Erwinia amylovora ACW56400]CBA20574.1 hypothetical protein predicted by Glimmer/Critica [Erwinia amylovora CFBP1430]CCO78478.1 hypothetical protein BN432_1675 [Erwinia amylovora Ea356]CCO82272.1 hypothetical protein BN433_1697 [Erwinia amylovora Ea266]CCO86060.1 hypothetical protein BN434_1667 [Erwinia amylovora CFBP 2585]CCO89850.1 hypothetical protein BN435_1674 [Erwinia amylovora 01SFR-BO]CC